MLRKKKRKEFPELKNNDFNKNQKRKVDYL